MKYTQDKIIEVLLSGNYMSEEDLKKAKDSLTVSRESVLDYLLNEEIVNKNIIGQALAESLAVPYSDLDANAPEVDHVFRITEKVAQKFRVVFMKQSGEDIIITTDDPLQENLKEELEKIFPNKNIKITFSLPEDIDNILSFYQSDLDTKFIQIISEKKQIAPEVLLAIFDDAVSLRASDIHFEPRNTDVLIRFRIDGVLRDVAKLPKEQYENVLNRIKVQSGIRLDEHFAAQDGAMQSKNNGITVDLRVSVVPTVEGEKVVLRVLSSYVQGLVLSELGLSHRDNLILEEIANKPFGMIVVTGPTGSGKTTTLYALLKILNKSDVNITTIEDPVEYKMSGVNQIQVNSVTELTFAKGLRSIVRQDPDIILVGEIRDNETAEISINASLTGHLLLSTFHASDASVTIPRMLDMGIEPFLLASTLELIVAQRLARKICSHCKQSITLSAHDIEKMNDNLKEYFKYDEYTLYEGRGCDFCGDSGYKGRVALFEMIRMTPELQELVLKHPSSQEIWELAQKQGSVSMFEDGVEKVKNGMITIAELLRVADHKKRIKNQ